MGKYKSNGLFTTLGVMLIVGSMLVNKFSSFTLPELAENISVKIKKKLNDFEGPLNKLLQENISTDKARFFNQFDKDKTGYYLFKKDSLILWNNAQIPVTNSLIDLDKNDGIVRLKQGYYLFKKQTSGSFTAFALRLIKSKYELENNYLKNDFAEWLNVPKDVALNEKTGTIADVEINGRKVFSITGNDIVYTSSFSNELCAFLFLAGCFILFISVLLFFKKHNTVLNALAVLIILAILKLAMIYTPPLKFLADTFLYDVHLFANAQSVINAHLADILFNSAAMMFVSLIFYLHFTISKNKATNVFRIFCLFLLVFAALWQYSHSLQSMIVNSTLSFDFLNVFSIRWGAVIFLATIVFNSITLFIALYKATFFFNYSRWLSFLAFMVCSFAVCAVLNLTGVNKTFFQRYWLLLFSAVLFILVEFRVQKFSIAIGILIAIMSATTAGISNYFIGKNEKDVLTALSDKLSERQDPQLENEFLAIPSKIKSDKNLSTLIMFLPGSKKEIDELLRQRYFRGYFNKYKIDFSLFDKNCTPLLKPSQAVLLNEGFFEERIEHLSDSISPGLFFVSRYKRNSQYIGRINFENYNLYILFDAKQFEELGSLPDLLLEASHQKPEKLKDFSWAVYRAGQKTNNSGDFNYPFYFIDSTALSKTNTDYVHHFFKTDDETEVIISETNKDWKYFFTYNSYLFLFFSLMSFSGYFIYSWLFTTHFQSSSLSRKIQTIIVVLLLFAISTVGITSGNLVTRQFESDNVKSLQEKSQNILYELTAQVKPDDLFAPSIKELVNGQLQEYVHDYNTDISLFDSRGILFNTSQPKLYELGLADSLANPKAYFNLKGNQSSSFYITEKAGTLNYLSLYAPIFNESKKLIGFINLPYFARQSDLTNELANIISALINVYILLFVTSIIAGLILSGYITKPLRLIKQQIANITLSRQNEAINWDSNDEVGKLIGEYNNMLIKLEHSANLLAQSERESAWREMAKQVAHEIKNPLTPMKLNIQYLQHLMTHSPEDFKERFEKASASIIEQIDTLAGIATEFSNFAKLPATQLQKINLEEIIYSSVNLFDQKNTFLRVNIDFKEMLVNGDKEQALRVFNNVIKNAIQATEDVRDPEVVISAEETPDSYIIQIRDNGCGIANNMKDKIFTPNFTTKSTGSGLGLAMVKNIMSNFGGRIWFTSQENKGTTFYLEFVKA